MVGIIGITGLTFVFKAASNNSLTSPTYTHHISNLVLKPKSQ